MANHRAIAIHGIPILVKDNIATKDKLLDVSAGSYALLGAKPALESSLISKLRAAGVVILGKTNLSEWANFRGLNISNGWSPRGGQTLGTYYPNSTPAGSSSGSAVATALGLSTAAIGTETWGSIVGPAELNNVVGFKPTRGLISTDGVIPISSRQDVIGTLTRTVKDAAYLLSEMAGRSKRDERTWHIPFNPIPDFTTFCKGTDLSGITIGVPRNTWEGESPAPIQASFESALQTLSSAGANVVEDSDFPQADDFKKLNEQVKGIVRSSEFKRDIVRYLQTLETNPNNIQSAEDIIEFTKRFPAEEYPDRDIGKFLWTQAEGVDVDGDKYKEMVKQEQFFGGEGGILGAMKKYHLDVLVVPADQDIGNDLAAKMGFPVISVPLGFWPEDTSVQLDKKKPNLVKVAPGMPYSLIFITKAFSDGVLLQVAHAFEQLTAVRENGPLPIKVPETEMVVTQRKAERM
ncbi:putative amidase [Mollisia scopiformis]|uniref:Putative amidase n=1 Tax=Mollisia scopiformis TaxID=149040 RepID=A0A194XPU3_MOLSC|nr:putative amidase [Mollisia scopiformis]KUJ22181.1 putative amidase [Mollisia scopiformis]